MLLSVSSHSLPFFMSLIKALLLPPGLQLLLLFTALTLWFRRPLLAFVLVTVAMLSLYLLSTGLVANWLMRGLEPPTVTPEDSQQAQAIVVLGTGAIRHTPEYDNIPQPGALLRQRLDYAIHLTAQSKLPILVTGGSPTGVNEAEVMQRYLHDNRTEAQWIEDKSRNTRENALYSVPLLRKDGIDTVLLVSHAWHMQRGCLEFEQLGITCLPAPTAYANQPVTFPLLPQAIELRKSQLAIKEYFGLIWFNFWHMFDR